MATNLLWGGTPLPTSAVPAYICCLVLHHQTRRLDQQKAVLVSPVSSYLSEAYVLIRDLEH